jgi:endonuclease/exonuclease/phosphatase
MTLNTLNGHVSASKVVDIVRTQKVELLALQEVSQGFLQELSDAGIHDLLPYSVLGSSGRSDNGGINVLFSATQMSDQNTSLLPIETSAMPAGSLSIGGTTVRFVSAHPNSPHKGGQGLWSEGLTTIAKLANYSHSYVILGDFNATWDHARFRELLGSSFVDAGEQAGEGFHMTYPANSTIPPLIEIDHIVYSRDAGLYVGDLQTISVAGSDHLALLATLEAS